MASISLQALLGRGKIQELRDKQITIHSLDCKDTIICDIGAAQLWFEFDMILWIEETYLSWCDQTNEGFELV